MNDVGVEVNGPPFVGAAEVLAPTEVASAVVQPTSLGEIEYSKRQKRFHYQPCEIVALVYACHAACIAKPQSTFQYRSTYVRGNYSKFA